MPPELANDLELSDIAIEDEFLDDEDLPEDEIELASLKSIHHNR